MPAEISVLGRPEIQTDLSISDFPGFRKKEPSPDLPSIDNERSNTNIVVLKPLSEKEELKPFFSYLSCTRQLEIGTAKTEYLQEIADKMTQDTGTKSRVVVMQKGRENEAFITGDGTIFLSQSLINNLGSVDEIAAVIAHEAGHLLNHSAQSASKTWNKLGVSWVHELAADTQTPSLLEKAGFNSLAFASTIEKISGVNRGIEHQGGITRASESVGTHFGINRDTSAQDFLAKPDLLLGEANPTNFELFADAYKAQNRKREAEMIELLHLQDLIRAYQRLSELQNQEFVKVKINGNSVRVIKENEMEIALQKKAAAEIKKVLAEQGVTEDEQTIVLMCITPTRSIYDSMSPDKRRFSGINNPDKIRDLARLIAKDEDQKRLDDLCQKAGFFPDTVSISSFLSTLGDNLFDPSNTPKARGIPVNIEEIFLDALTTIANNSAADPLILGGMAIKNYIVRSIVKYDPKNTTQSSADKTKIQTVLKKVVERKILTDFDSINDLTKSDYNGKEFYDHTGAIASVGYFPSGMSGELADEIMQNLLFKEEEIQSFFSNLKNLHSASIPYELNRFLKRIERSFAGKEKGENQISEDERLRIARRIMEEMKKDERLNADRGLLRYGILAAAAIFRQDTDQFYTFMDEAASSDQMRGLSPESAFSFLKPIFKKNYSSSSKNRLISNFDRFAGLPPVQLALEYLPFKPESIKSIAQLFNAMKIMDRMSKNEPDDQYSLESLFKQPLVFEDSLVGLVLGREYRKKLLELTQKDIPTGDLHALHGCLKLMYLDGPEKTHFLCAISKKILISSNLTFENKLLYLQQNIDELGPGGLSLLAEQIEDLETYQKFRIAMQKSFGEYLSGKAATFNVAALDIISSSFAEGFKELFDLCRNDPVTQKNHQQRLLEIG